MKLNLLLLFVSLLSCGAFHINSVSETTHRNRIVGPLRNAPDDEDAVDFTKGERLGVEQLPVGEAPLDIFDTHWRFNCKMRALSTRVEYRYDLVLPIHLRLDQSVETVHDSHITDVSDWKLYQIHGETFLEISMYLRDLDGFLPNNRYHFNARLEKDEEGHIFLRHGIIRTHILLDFYDVDAAIDGTLTGAPFSEGMFSVGEFSIDPINFDAIPRAPKDHM